MWEAVCKLESSTKPPKRGRKRKPKEESLPFVQKKKRGRKRKFENKNVAAKRDGGPTPKLTCESKNAKKDSVKVLFEDGNLTPVNN